MTERDRAADEESGGGAQPGLPARAGEERLAERVVRTGMFGVSGDGDTSGYGGLRVRKVTTLSSPRPYGSYFDEVADALEQAIGVEGMGSVTRSSALSSTGVS